MAMSTGTVIKTQRLISSRHPGLAPHQKLPVELVADIFVQCISVEFTELTRACRRNPDQVFAQGMYPHHIRARLALVCRAWYTILYNDARVWATMVLQDTLMTHTETVSLWIKRSKSIPLVIFIPDCPSELGFDSLFSMLRKEMWRIRHLLWDISDETDLLALFPLGVSTNAPMLRSLALFRTYGSCFNHDISKLGDIDCPELHTLYLRGVNVEIQSLTVRSLKNINHLIVDLFWDLHDGNVVLPYLRILKALPNLVSLSWQYHSICPPDSFLLPKVVLQSLESLTLKLCWEASMTITLKCLQVPSLERLVLDLAGVRFTETDMDAICESIDAFRHSLVRLRHLTLRNMELVGRWVSALLKHLKHLETLTIENLNDADELFIALSFPRRGSSTPCPSLRTVDILDDVNLTPDVLVDFVQQRVKSDLDDPARDLVTCLKLLRETRSGKTRYNKKLCARLAKTHRSSIIFRDHTLER